MKMRWVLTVKSDGSAKARLVVLGLQDHRLGKMPTQAPTVSDRGRNLALQLMANKGLRMRKGDVKAAFLQGNSTQGDDNIFAEPCAELREGLGVTDEYVVKLWKAVYGLCNAPREWYETVNSDMLRLGWTPVSMEPCAWTLWENGRLVAVAFIHVDDMVVGVAEGNVFVDRKMKEVEALYRWGRWEHTSFDQCGADLLQLKDGTIMQSLERATKKVAMIELPGGSRAAKDDEKLSLKGQTLCRAALGSLQFLASQGMCWLSADVSIMSGHVPTATRGLIKKINKLIRFAHETSNVPVVFRPIVDPVFVTWHDAAWGCRVSGASQGGFLVAMAERRLLKGERSPVSCLVAASKKLPRVTRSSLGAETQSGSMASEEQEFVRLLWLEMSTGKLDLQNINGELQKTTGVMVTDCKGLYDSVCRVVSSGLGVADRRTAIEALGLRQGLARSGTIMRWVHSEAMPADGLTKDSKQAHNVLLDFLTRGYWRLVQDESFTASKKRKAQGREDILDDGVVRAGMLPTDPTEEMDPELGSSWTGSSSWWVSAFTSECDDDVMSS